MGKDNWQQPQRPQQQQNPNKPGGNQQVPPDKR